MVTLAIVDRAPAGGRPDTWDLEIFDERLALRELIRRRVFQEVAEHNARRSGSLRGRLAGVPVMVFSEAMRDVDLLIAVTSIAGDPHWVDRGEEHHYADYWRRASAGELSATAQVRRAALERLIPRTKIADRCTLTDRYLVVRGDLHTYKIHLGSGNFLMDRDDRYLCIVPSARKGPGQVFLPFEEDRLMLILSKAFLLGDDARITDPSILAQLRSR